MINTSLLCIQLLCHPTHNSVFWPEARGTPVFKSCHCLYVYVFLSYFFLLPTGAPRSSAHVPVFNINCFQIFFQLIYMYIEKIQLSINGYHFSHFFVLLFFCIFHCSKQDGKITECRVLNTKPNPLIKLILLYLFIPCTQFSYKCF